MAMGDIHMNAVELSGLDSKQNNDDSDLARLGKNPVLKVWRPRETTRYILLMEMTAKFWLHVHFGLQLHGTYYLGRLSNVRPQLRISCRGISANTTKSLRARLCKVDLSTHHSPEMF